MKFRATALLICLAAIVLTLGCAAVSPGIVSVTLTDQVEEQTMAPKAPRDSFTTATTMIYAATLVSNPRKGTQVEAQWTFAKDGQGSPVPVDSSSVTFGAASAQNYVAFSLKAVTTFLPGTYKVQILLDGKPARDVTFTIAEK